MTENPEIRLNPDHDVKAYREAFARDKMLHIPNILVPEAAKRLHRCLTEEISWNLTYNDDEGLQHLFASKMAKMTPAERVALQQKVLQRAKTGKFQFFFGSFAIEDAYKENIVRDMYISRFYEFVNSEPFLDFMREITGFKTIAHATQQATAYGPGHFLTDHNDFEPGKSRKVAMVFNLTPEWKAEWGGILEFIDQEGKTTSGLIPSFNALNFFAVPRRHVVTQVATYSPAIRYAITGWLVERDYE
ncbi:MAG: 2OG-Fe(II) oxygenase [Proteobacteria bacterium]|nr:2OG-Fe(II) oxygenase [Pseudomonadota bacterium]MCH8322731.1 2OG-Fe(II) oxygenase [Pseudomonadota bacterium]